MIRAADFIRVNVKSKADHPLFAWPVRTNPEGREGGGTPIHYLYGYVLPNGGRDFEAPDLERGNHFRGVF